MWLVEPIAWLFFFSFGRSVGRSFVCIRFFVVSNFSWNSIVAVLRCVSRSIVICLTSISMECDEHEPKSIDQRVFTIELTILFFSFAAFLKQRRKVNSQWKTCNKNRRWKCQHSKSKRRVIFWWRELNAQKLKMAYGRTFCRFTKWKYCVQPREWNQFGIYEFVNIIQVLFSKKTTMRIFILVCMNMNSIQTRATKRVCKSNGKWSRIFEIKWRNQNNILFVWNWPSDDDDSYPFSACVSFVYFFWLRKQNKRQWSLINSFAIRFIFRLVHIRSFSIAANENESRRQREKWKRRAKKIL